MKILIKLFRVNKIFMNLLVYVFHIIKVVIPNGFEPLTYCLEGSCSIQLSYENIIKAESERFELPDLLQSTVFKTAAIDHSAISPRQR